jgi:hypothetical protein
MPPDVGRAIALFGTEEPVPKSVTLRAGPLTVDLENGALRCIRYQGTEVIRSIAYLFRDRDWLTPPAKITNLKVGQGPDSFRVGYDGRVVAAEHEFVYHASIQGRSDGALSFEVAGTALTEILANRIGFVVLHPLSGVAGELVEVTHIDGSMEHARFPRLISPAQPFFDIRALAHQVVPGVWVTCTMEGDAYEMEDHRNWMDASYKTYVRPLSKPRPFTLAPAERMAQRVSLAFRGTPSATPKAGKDAVTVTLGAAAGTMPRIGLGVPAEEAKPALAIADLLKHVAPGFLVGHIDLRDPAAGAELPQLKALAEVLGAPVVLEIVLPNERAPADELADVADDARDAGLALEAVVPCPAAYLKSWQPNEAWPEVPPLEQIYAAARKIFPGLLIGGGMLSYFTELNRKRPPVDAIDFITHTVCPIVHDADDRTVMDNLEALLSIAESIRAIAGDKPYRLGPSAIGMRQNPYGTSPVDNLDNGRVAMAINDPRQRGLFGAAWNLALVAHAAQAGIEALALAAPSGACGIVYRTLGWSQPWFDEHGRGVFPLFHVLADLARAAGRARLEATASHGRAIQALAYRDGDEAVLWLANLTPEPRPVRLEGLSSKQAEVARLDAPTFPAITSGPDGFRQGERLPRPDGLELDAFAVARIRLRA